MATNKKAISAYIPEDLEEYLTKYCTEYDITRKDKSGEIKPALGTAVVEILRIFFSNENVPSPLPSNGLSLPSNVVTQDDLSDALSKLPSIVDKKLETAIAQGKLAELIASQLTSLKTELHETIEKKFTTLVSEFEATHDYNLPTIAKIDNKKKLLSQIDKSSLDPVFDDDINEEKDADWNELKVGELRKVITIKGLGNKFREKLGKSPRESKKAEIVKFLEKTSIFDS